MMKITGLSHLFKWENLHNWWLTKYFFAPLYMVKKRNKSKMCNEIKKCKTIRCAKKTVYWDLINSNVNKRDVQTGCSGYCT